MDRSSEEKQFQKEREKKVRASTLYDNFGNIYKIIILMHEMRINFPKCTFNESDSFEL